MRTVLAAAVFSVCVVLTALSVERVDIHPQAFDAGGWSLDVQFMDVMGSPYLIAHGRGIRCLDATAAAEVPSAGDWRVWVRARKWVDGAGAFRVKVNGVELERTFGVSQKEWAWEDGGTVALPKGDVRIALVDTDGFDGRCAGVVLTRGAPPPQGALKLDEGRVDEDLSAEFAVIGGGLPGTCAAVAAARRGVRTVIVQDRPMLGGNASSEIRVWCAGEARYPLVWELRGWFMNRNPDMALSDARRQRVAADEPNLTVLTSTRAFGVEKNPDGTIAAVKALDWRRNRIVRIAAPLFCDATGDGWVGYWAGADWRMGREARDEFGEGDFAPEKADGLTLGSSVMWTSSEASADIPFRAEWAEPWANGETAVNGEWNWEYGIRQGSIAEGEWVRDRLLLAAYGAFSRAKRDPANARRVINFMPFLLGKRETRRLMGDYVLSARDFREHTAFEDAVASTSWSIDLHYDDKKPGVDFLSTSKGPFYHGRCWIPYRSIYSRNVGNLFMAGRCFSCTHVGLGSPRVINTLSQLGVAAGEAAALCRQYGCSPRQVYSERRYRELQDRLGGEFPGRPDPKLANWRIVDDESDGVAFEGKWRHEFCENGEQVGEKASVAVNGAKKAVYPLPVGKAGRYRLMMRVPWHWNIRKPSSTTLALVTSDGETELSVDQTLDMGSWRELGVFSLEPGATLTVDATKSTGSVYADGFALVPVFNHLTP